MTSRVQDFSKTAKTEIPAKTVNSTNKRPQVQRTTGDDGNPRGCGVAFDREVRGEARRLGVNFSSLEVREGLGEGDSYDT